MLHVRSVCFDTSREFEENPMSGCGYFKKCSCFVCLMLTLPTSSTEAEEGVYLKVLPLKLWALRICSCAIKPVRSRVCVCRLEGCSGWKSKVHAALFIKYFLSLTGLQSFAFPGSNSLLCCIKQGWHKQQSTNKHQHDSFPMLELEIFTHFSLELIQRHSKS